MNERLPGSPTVSASSRLISGARTGSRTGFWDMLICCLGSRDPSPAVFTTLSAGSWRFRDVANPRRCTPSYGGNKYAVSAHRVINIDETSCRLLPVHTIKWGRRGVKQAQHQGSTREPTTFTVALSMDRGALDGHVGAHRARWRDRRRLALATTNSPRRVGERLGNHVDDTRARRRCGRRDEPREEREHRGFSSGDMASIHASEALLPHVVLCIIPRHSISY